MKRNSLTAAKVFALRGYTLKIERGKYFIAPTIAFKNQLQWKGPYRSLQHACTAVARKLQAEFAKRNGGSHVS